jgi:hypothetical protein
VRARGSDRPPVRRAERGRLKLLETNASVYRDVVPRIVAVAPDAVLVAVTDPPDPLADLTRALVRHDRVLSARPTNRRGRRARAEHVRGRAPRLRAQRRDAARRIG